MFSERPAGLHRCSFHGHEIWEQMRQNMKAEKAKSQQLLVSSVNYTHLSGWSICVKLKWAAWDQCCTEKSEADIAEIQCSHATRSRKRMNRLSYVVFLHLAQRWGCLFWPERPERSLEDLCDQDPTRLSSRGLCQEEQVILQAVNRHGNRQTPAQSRDKVRGGAGCSAVGGSQECLTC